MKINFKDSPNVQKALEELHALNQEHLKNHLYTACDEEDRVCVQVAELREQGIRAEPRLIKKGSLWHVELFVNGEVYAVATTEEP